MFLHEKIYRLGHAAAAAGLLWNVGAYAEPVDGFDARFGDRFSVGSGPLAPTFTRPEVIQLLSAVRPTLSDADGVASNERSGIEPYRPGQIAFAEPKGPAKVLKDLLTTPLKELLVSRAEAGTDELPKPSSPQEAAAAPTGPASSSSENASVPPRAADPLSERPRAEAVASLPAPAAAQGAEPGPDQRERSAQTRAAVPLPEPNVVLTPPPVPSPPEVPPVDESAPRKSLTASPEQPQPRQHSAAAPSPDASLEPSRSPGQPETTGAVELGRRIGKGSASWYEHPGRTASGEIFDPTHLTAAHHTLPFGTHVRVVEESRGRSVVVRINDRIPRKAAIAIDLSRASARAIGVTGVARVSLYEVGPAGVTASVEAQDVKVGESRRKDTKSTDLARGRQPTRAMLVPRRINTSRDTSPRVTTLLKTKAAGTVRKTRTPVALVPRASHSIQHGNGPEFTYLAAPVRSDPPSAFSLPENLVPTEWEGSGHEETTYVRDLGWVRGTPDAIKGIHQPLPPVPEKAFRAVSACTEGILELAKPRGAVRSEATIAGPQRRGQRVITVPVEVRVTYSGVMNSQTRQAQVACQLDRNDRVVGFKPRM